MESRLHAICGMWVTDGRRYPDAEVREILTWATDTRSVLPIERNQNEGLTIPELQEIGAEVGIPPAVVAHAARSLERRSGVERTLGLPMAVSHSVPLPRPPTDVEWERLVADLPETFGARGTVRVDGGLRGWHNGNLHALVEPRADGSKLRMGTTKGSARELLGMGAAMVMGVVVLALLSLVGLGPAPGELARISGTLGRLGAAGVGVAAVQLPRGPGSGGSR